MRLVIDLKQLHSRGVEVIHPKFDQVEGKFSVELEFPIHTPLFKEEAVKEVSSQVGERMADIFLDMAADTLIKRIIMEIVAQA